MTTRSVLIIEDECDIARLLSLHLEKRCDEVVVADNGNDGLHAAEQRRWGLIILDLGLPGIGGLEICRRLRAGMRYSPVLMLTARCAEQERIEGLRIGADDYVTKPFSLQELLARVDAIFRRCAALAAPSDQDTAERLQHHDLQIDVAARTVHRQGHEINLTAREFDLLSHFVRHPDRVYSRSQLLDQVWGHGHEGYEHTVNSHINRLRAKIEDEPAQPRHIVTVWGVGYRLG
jgi:DNA-binding response OmpR family regulator